MRAVFAVLSLALLLSACSSVPLQSEGLLSAPPVGAPAHELEAVAFFPQERYQCGPAALATVLVASGVEVSPQQLISQVYIPERRGSLQAEMIAAARGYGRIAYRLQGGLADLLQEIEAGHPVLVMQNLGLSWLPQWHYAVVVGYDLAANRIVLRSGTRRRHTLSLQAFERTWRRAAYWALVTLPPSQLPATAREGAYLQAVADLEAAGQLQNAHRAYQGALGPWPESRVAWMGLGNSAYALGDRAGAAQAFRRLLEHEPDYAPALNNLAQTLADLGELQEALALAKQAVALGGREQAIYRQTLVGIEARLARP